MIFRVGWPNSTERDVCYLRKTSWDDWYKFETLFNLLYIDANGESHEIGGTKMALLLHPWVIDDSEARGGVRRG